MADTAVRATVTELPESRVRVEAEVPSAEVERSLDRAARQLGRDLRIPGFLPQWYIDAVDAAGIAPVGEPSLDVGDLPERGQPLTFSIEVGVRPKAELASYKELEVGRAEPEADDAAVDREIDTLRDRLARLDVVERPAEKGDFLTVKVTFPEDYGAEHLAGQDAEFAVSVKEVKAKQLPEVDDDLAEEAGFDTLAELREDIATRLREAEDRRIA